jgi:hypothetical protein
MRSLLQSKDLYAGCVIIFLGAFVALHALTYNLGSFMRMGPGMFPLILGLLLTFIGALIVISGLMTSSPGGGKISLTDIEWRGCACILAGPLMFILFGTYFGMVAGAFMCVFVSALGDRNARLKNSAILATGVTIAGCILFSYGLRVPLPLFRWGF